MFSAYPSPSVLGLELVSGFRGLSGGDVARKPSLRSPQGRTGASDYPYLRSIVSEYREYDVPDGRLRTGPCRLTPAPEAVSDKGVI